MYNPIKTYQRKQMNKGLTVVATSALISGLAMYLFTPQRGEDNRKMLKKRIQNATSKVSNYFKGDQTKDVVDPDEPDNTNAENNKINEAVDNSTEAVRTTAEDITSRAQEAINETSQKINDARQRNTSKK
jgi:gas vesicle protein